jgi:hypothetical protein
MSVRCLVLASLLVLGAADVAYPAQRLDDPAGGPAGESDEKLQLLDRVLALVDEDPILASDVERVLALGLEKAAADEDETALRRRVLDRLIDERLRLHEVERFGFTEISVAEIEAQVEALRERLGGEAALAERLEDAGLQIGDLHRILATQLRVLAYVEERLGPRVFVTLDEIQSYYDDELVPALAAKGQKPPPLPEVREEIRRLLRERLLDAEIDRWTEDLRRRADILDYFDREERELPPVRARR